MPGLKGEPISKQRQNLTLFGKRFYLDADYLGVSMPEVARRMDMSASTLSRCTRFSGTSGPERDTVVKISIAFVAIAEEKQLQWGDRSVALFHSAGYATPAEIEAAELEIIAEQQTDRRAEKKNKERLDL